MSSECGWSEVSESCTESEHLLGDAFSGPKLLGGGRHHHYAPVESKYDVYDHHDATHSGHFDGSGGKLGKSIRDEKFKRLPKKTVGLTVAALTGWIVLQTVIFWLIAWKGSTTAAHTVVLVILLVTLVGPLFCCAGRRVLSFPFPPGGGLQWGCFVISGLVIGTFIAMGSGYNFAEFSLTGEIVVSRNVSPLWSQTRTLTNLEKSDYVAFTPSAFVSKARAARVYSPSTKTYYCAGPVFGPSEKMTQVNFYAVTNDACCRQDSYECDGWTHKGFTGRVLHRYASKGAAAVAPEAIQAAALAATNAGLDNNPSFVFVHGLSVSDTPSDDADRFWWGGAISLVVGLLLWPIPALLVWWAGLRKDSLRNCM